MLQFSKRTASYYIKNIFTSTKCHFRQMSSVEAVKLKYNEYGEPAEVLTICKEKIDAPIGNEVLVKTLASPVNPADINIIQGKYPIKPPFPATGGNECVGEIIEVGPKVTKFKKGDRVVPFTTNIGTWSSYLKFPEGNFMKVSNKIGIPEAATITVNPCTAYRMLKDFVDLKPGDTVLQNGANSAVGQAVHQLCRAWNISSVGVVRNRPDIADLKSHLQSLGATEVLTEEEIRTTQIFKSKLKKPKLVFNCVGGKSATEVARHLENHGVHVTYGGMSREPVTVATAALIFKDIAFRGFWMTRWNADNAESPKKLQMIDELGALMERGEFIAPVHEMVPFENFKYAMEGALNFKGFAGKKFILDLQNV